MSTHAIQAVAPDPNAKSLFRVGAIATFVLVLGWLLTFPIYGSVGIAPPGAEARLLHYGTHAAGWWSILGLMVSTDLVYVVVWLALYDALKGIDRALMLLALASHLLFVVLDLAVTWTNHAALFTLGAEYLKAATDAEKALLAAAARAPAAVLDSPPAAVYAIAIPALGTLLAGIVVLKGGLSKVIGYLAIAVGVTGVAAVVGPHIIGPSDPTHIINALLATIWYIWAGWTLFKLGRSRSHPE
jgi:hypothetical protein